MECRLPASRIWLCVALSAALAAEHAYWWVRAGRRVRGDSFFIPLATRWLYVLGASKLVSAAFGFATIGAAVDVVPLVGPRAVWNVLKVVLGCTDLVFGYIDSSAFPHRPALMPMLLVAVVAATWLAPVLSLIFVWFVIGTASPSTVCLSNVSDVAAAALVIEAASMLVLPIVDAIGGGMSRDGAPMCLRGKQKARYPRVAFGRTGPASAARVRVLTGKEHRDSVTKDTMGLVSSAWEQWTPERLDTVILAIELSRRNGVRPTRRHSAPTEPKDAVAQLRKAYSPGARSPASRDSGVTSSGGGRGRGSSSASRRASQPTAGTSLPSSLPSRDSLVSAMRGDSASPIAALRTRSADAFGIAAVESAARRPGNVARVVPVGGAVTEVRPAVYVTMRDRGRDRVRGGPPIRAMATPPGSSKSTALSVSGSPLRNEQPVPRSMHSVSP